MADVFVSYKREDATKVRKLVDALRGDGLGVWWDEDIPPAAPWETTIEKALKDARAVIVCWSPASVESENVRSEARIAREDGRLIQVFVRPCSPPLFFGERQGVDLSTWRGKADDRRIAAIAEGVRAITGAKSSSQATRTRQRGWFAYRMHAAAIALLLIAGSFAGWWLLAPAKAAGPQTLAVLPFRALNPADSNLVDAIWDDTRGALERNPNLRVLGREAVTALAKQDLPPAAYRKKVGADYLLDGSVQHEGDQVRIKLSLTRTDDGTEVWSDELGGKLDDVFVFQTRIANEVEGRIRGRVAPGGGASEQNIATSGEVYAIYADARSKVRLRDADNARAAEQLLRRALAIDPNYAPAWANLGVAVFFARQPSPQMGPVRAEATADLKRALTLAPNFAFAHAAIAMVQDFPPESEGELRKAVTLDPGSAEAWSWLGNFYVTQNRWKDALEAQSRAVEIEPLWWTAVGNRVSTLAELNDQAGVDAELKRIERTQDTVLLRKVQWRVAAVTNHPGDAVAILLKLRADHPEEAAWIDRRIESSLFQLGFIDEGLRARKLPHDRFAEFDGTPISAAMLDARYKRPADFWQDSEMAARYTYILPSHGRLDEWLRRYRSAFASPDDFLAGYSGRLPVLRTMAPAVAANLRAAGQGAEADAILRATEPTVIAYSKNGALTAFTLADLASYRAADGKGDEAISLLNRAVAAGWLPDNPVDLEAYPQFAPFAKRQDFQAIRQRILARIGEERRKVSPVMLVSSGLGSKLAA